MFHFEQMLTIGNVVGGVFGVNRHTELGNDFTCIIIFRHPMYGHPCFGLPCRLDSFMHMVAIHPLSAKLRQECRMDIDDGMIEPSEKKVRYELKETRQHNEVDFKTIHHRQKPIS